MIDQVNTSVHTNDSCDIIVQERERYNPSRVGPQMTNKNIERQVVSVRYTISRKNSTCLKNTETRELANTREFIR